MIRWLDSVKFDRLHPTMVLAAIRAEALYETYGMTDVWITSANDSTHMTGSKHYDGRAFDLRIRNIAFTNRKILADELRRALGPQFTVLYGDAGHLDHIHIQFNGL